MTCAPSRDSDHPEHLPSLVRVFIFYIWSFKISVNFLRNQKLMIGLDSYSRQVFNYLDPILIYIMSI